MSLAGRRRGWLWAGGLVGGTMLAVSALLPVPFVELSPGPTFNVIGEIDDTPLIEIAGTTTYPTNGHLDMTTVNERGGPDGGIYVGRVIVGWLDPAIRVVPRESLFPDDTSSDDIKAENVRQFSDSQADSVAAALTFLDRPFDTLVVASSVRDGTPADGKLEPGDELLAIGTTTIATVDDVANAMKAVTPGDTVRVTVERGAAEQTVEITTTTSPVDPDRAYLGITVGETYRPAPPMTIDVTLDGVGGPSAGMMLSLGIIDKLTAGELNGGRFVAGTGTITPDGEVGPIGGIEQKLVGARTSGATLFLAPADNCAAVLATTVPDGLTVARVSTLAEAVSTIESYVAGKPVTPCG